MSVIQKINSIGQPVINNWNYIGQESPITNTNMVPYNGYVCTTDSFSPNQYNFFFPSLLVGNELFTVISYLPTQTMTISIAPSSGAIIFYGGSSGTSINCGGGVTITFRCTGFPGFIVIESTNSATFTLT